MLFQQYGESYFRGCEEAIIRELLNEPEAVVSLGGGALHWSNNHEWIGQRGQLFVLLGKWTTVAERLALSNRPLAAQGKVLFEQRKALYERIGTSIWVDHLSPAEVCAHILEKIDG